MQTDDPPHFNHSDYCDIVQNYRKLFPENFFEELQKIACHSVPGKLGYYNLLSGDPCAPQSPLPAEEYEQANTAIQNIMVKYDKTYNLEYEKQFHKGLVKLFEAEKFPFRLAFGLNPWTDYFMRLWGEEYQGPDSDPCQLLVVGGDWNPLWRFNSAPSYIHKLDKKYLKFFETIKGNERCVESFIGRKHVFYMNAFPFLRTGNGTTGAFSPDYTDVAKKHIKAVIEVVNPKIIVSWGGNAKNSLNPSVQFLQESKFEGTPWFPLYHPAANSKYWGDNGDSLNKIRNRLT